MVDRASPGIARLFAIGIAVAVATLGLLLALPHDRYVRWQTVRTEAYARLGWVYERVHYDATPIDIALIGTSHMLNGIDGLAVAKRIAATGVRAPGGRCLTVTNFAIPSYGRNLHWLLARELMETRRPRAIVLEAFENETRKAHPLFASVADSRDIVTAPVLLNINYASDMVRLPYRQLQAAVESLMPAQFGLKARFDPARYDGSTVDNTHVANVGGQAVTGPLSSTIASDELDRKRAGRAAIKELNILPKAFESWEYALPRTYVAAIMEMARETGTPVYILYLPGYGQPPRPVDMRYYRQASGMFTLNDLLARRDIWFDVHHLNTEGAALASARLADDLAGSATLRGLPHAAGGGACDFGYPAVRNVKPFVPPWHPG